MEENKKEIVNEITPKTVEVVAAPNPKKPRVSKSTKVVEATIDIPVAEENQQEPFIEELDSPIELEPKKEKKDKKKKKSKKNKKGKKQQAAISPSPSPKKTSKKPLVKKNKK